VGLSPIVYEINSDLGRNTQIAIREYSNSTTVVGPWLRQKIPRQQKCVMAVAITVILFPRQMGALS